MDLLPLAGSRPCPPASGRVLTGEPVYRLAEEVGVAGVPAVLLDQVAHEAPQAGVAAVGPGDVDELAGAAVGQGGAESGPGPFDGVVPQRVELFRVSLSGRNCSWRRAGCSGTRGQMSCRLGSGSQWLAFEDFACVPGDVGG